MQEKIPPELKEKLLQAFKQSVETMQDEDLPSSGEGADEAAAWFPETWERMAEDEEHLEFEQRAQQVQAWDEEAAQETPLTYALETDPDLLDPNALDILYPSKEVASAEPADEEDNSPRIFRSDWAPSSAAKARPTDPGIPDLTEETLEEETGEALTVEEEDDDEDLLWEMDTVFSPDAETASLQELADTMTASTPSDAEVEESVRLAAERLSEELAQAEQALFETPLSVEPEELPESTFLAPAPLPMEPPAVAESSYDFSAIYDVSASPEPGPHADPQGLSNEPVTGAEPAWSAPSEAWEQQRADALPTGQPHGGQSATDPQHGRYPLHEEEETIKKMGANLEFDDTLSLVASEGDTRADDAATDDDIALRPHASQGVTVNKTTRSMGGSMSNLSGYKDLSKAPTLEDEPRKEVGAPLLSSPVTGGGSFEAVSAMAAESFAAHDLPPEVDADFNGNFQTLIRLINELPEGVTKQTGAQIIRLTMESMGIFMEDVLSDAQAAQSEMLDAVRANIKKIEEYKTIIRKLETDIKYYQGKANELSEIIDLFILSNTSGKSPNMDEFPTH
jgi:hypothetical protein